MSKPQKVIVHFRTENGIHGKVAGTVTASGIVCAVPKFAQVMGIERNGVISPRAQVLERKPANGEISAVVVEKKQ